MSVPSILGPLFVQVALTFVLLFMMAGLRLSALTSGETRLKDIALREPAWPKKALQVANAFHNQLELPVLFYVATIVAWQTNKADRLFVLLAWVFVALRLVHALVHVTSNDVRTRFYVFAAGVVALAVMWLSIALRVLLVV